MELAKAHAHDRKGYTGGKSKMIERLLEEAKREERPRAILICGRIASGKTTYAQRLCAEIGAVSLSCDELMLTLFGDSLGARFDEVSGRCKRYLYGKALELLGAGVSVVLDWGFWSPQERRYARGIFESAGYACELHHVRVSDMAWRRNIEQRNRLIAQGQSQAYPMDAGLLFKLERMYREPSDGEIDVLVEDQEA